MHIIWKICLLMIAKNLICCRKPAQKTALITAKKRGQNPVKQWSRDQKPETKYGQDINDTITLWYIFVWPYWSIWTFKTAFTFKASALSSTWSSEFSTPLFMIATASVVNALVITFSYVFVLTQFFIYVLLVSQSYSQRHAATEDHVILHVQNTRCWE